MTMQGFTRVKLLGAVVSVSTALSMVSAAQAQENINWKVQAVFSTHLPGLGDPIKWVTANLDRASGGKIKLDVYEPGDIVEPFEITEAVKSNRISAGYTWLGYDQDTIPASTLFAAVPFGMEPWEYASWWYDGNGKVLAENIYGHHNIHPVLCSVIGPETAGWFKKEIQTLDDIKGLNIRFAGLGGQVLENLGATVSVLPGSEIKQALESGKIDASEFSMPAIDTLMGFDEVAKNNYFPGWHQTFTASHLMVNKGVWSELSESQRAMIDMACTAGTFRALTRGEAIQGDFIADFEAKGVQAKKLPETVLRELETATRHVMLQQTLKDKDFAEVYRSQQEFMDVYSLWKRIAYLPRDF